MEILGKYEGVTLLASEVRVLQDLEAMIGWPIPDITHHPMAVFGFLHKFHRITELRLFISFFQQDYQLKSLPQSICELEALETLDVSHNQLSQLPTNFSDLHSLEKLYVDYNEFSTFPKVIFHLPKITQLNFDENKLSSLPVSIENITFLQSLQLAGNLLPQFPTQLSKLPYLKRLVLNRNLITQLDYTILEQFSRLYVLDLRNNPIPKNQIRKIMALIRLSGTKLRKFYLQEQLSDFEHPYSIRNILFKLHNDPLIKQTAKQDLKDIATQLKKQYDLHRHMDKRDEVISLTNKKHLDASYS